MKTTEAEVPRVSEDGDATGFPFDAETLAYQHAKEGCPYLDTDERCPVGCDEEECFI